MPIPADPPPEWGSDLSNVTTPSGALQASGWGSGATGVSSYDNWWKYTAWLWLVWMSEQNHDEQEIAIPTSAFVPDTSGGDYDAATATWSNTVGEIHAPLILPVGTRIISARVYYDVGASGSPSVTPSIKRKAIATGVITDVVVGTADTTDAGIESQLLSVNHIVTTGYAYMIVIDQASAGSLTLEAIVKYDRGVV